VVILGRTGRNFAAGMSGGVAYVLDADGTFPRRCNLSMVDLEPVDQPEDVEILQELIERHVALTGSTVGARLLDQWTHALHLFAKVMPRDYKRVLQVQAKAAAVGREASVEELTGAGVDG
jgi:glutamate synthase domain-containing protein 3